MSGTYVVSSRLALRQDGLVGEVGGELGVDETDVRGIEKEDDRNDKTEYDENDVRGLFPLALAALLLLLYCCVDDSDVAEFRLSDDVDDTGSV